VNDQSAKKRTNKFSLSDIALSHWLQNPIEQLVERPNVTCQPSHQAGRWPFLPAFAPHARLPAEIVVRCKPCESRFEQVAGGCTLAESSRCGGTCERQHYLVVVVRGGQRPRHGESVCGGEGLIVGADPLRISYARGA